MNINNTIRIGIIIFTLASIITIMGALMKIMHRDIRPLTPNYMLTVGMLSECIAIIILAIGFLKLKKD